MAKRSAYWLIAAAIAAALTVASLLATQIPTLSDFAGTRLFLLAVLAGVASAGCAFVAAALEMRDFVGLARTLLRERSESPMHLEELTEPQLVELDSSLEGLSRALAVENPVRIATGLKMASRALDAQTDAMRLELQRAAEATASAIDSHTRAFSGRLSDEQARLTQALDLYGETIATRLKLASVGLAREFRDNADQLQQRMQATGDNAVAGLSRQGETLAKALATAVEGLEFRMGDLSGETLTRLEAASAAAVAAIEARGGAALERFSASAQSLGAEIDSTFSAHVERAEDCRRGLLVAVDESGDAMGRRVAQAAQSVEASLERAVAGMNDRIEDALARIENRIDGRVAEVEGKLRALETEWEQRGVERREAIVAELAAASGAMHEAVAAAGAELGHAVGRQTAEIQAAFAEGSRASAQEWIGRAQAAALALESASAKAIDAASGVDAAVGERLAALEAGLGARAELLVERLAQQSHALGAAVRDLDEAAAAQAGELDARWNAWRAASEEARQAQAAFWAERSAGDSERLRELAGRHAAAVSEALDAHRGAMEAGFADALAAIGRDMAEREQHAGERLGRAAGGFVDGAIADLAALAETLSARGETLRGRFAAAQAELVEAMAAGLSRAEGQSGERLLAVSETLDGWAARIDAGLQTRSAEIAEALARAAEEVALRFAEGSRQTRQAIETGAGEALERLASGRAALLAEMAAASRRTAEAVEAGTVEAAMRLETARASLAQSVAQGASEAMRALTETAAAAGAEFRRQQSDLELTVEGAVTRIRDEFGAPLRETLQRVETESVELVATARKLTDSLAEVSTHQRVALHESFAREAGVLAGAIAENAENFRREFESAVSGADDVFLAHGMDLARVLIGRISELRELMSGDGVGLLKELDSSSARLAQQVEGASQRALTDFERKATTLIGLLTRRGDDLLSAMTASASESARKVGGLSREVEVEAERTAAALRETERKIEALLAQVERRSADFATLGARRPMLGVETLLSPRPAPPDADAANVQNAAT